MPFIPPTLSISKDSPRADHFLKIYQRLDDIPIKGPLPFSAKLPGFAEPRPVYLTDLTRVTPDERARIIDYIAVRFNIPPDEVDRDLDQHGFPILDQEDVSVSWGTIALSMIL